MQIVRIAKRNSEADFCLSIMTDWRNRMFCPNCGAEIKEGYKFCGNCGAEVSMLNDSMSTNQGHNMAAFSSNYRDMGYAPSHRDSMENKRKKRFKGIKIIGAIFLAVVVISLIFHGESDSASKGADKESKTTERVKKTFTMPEGDTVTEDYVSGSYVASDGSYFMICINQQWTADLTMPELVSFMGEDTSSECLMVTDDSTWHPDYAVIDVAKKEIFLKEDEKKTYQYKIDGKELTLKYPNGVTKKYTKFSDRYYGTECIIDKEITVEDVVGTYKAESGLVIEKYGSVGEEYNESISGLIYNNTVWISIVERDKEHVDIICFGERKSGGCDVYALNENVPIWEFIGGRVYFFAKGVLFPAYLEFYTDDICKYSDYYGLAEKCEPDNEFEGLDKAVDYYKVKVGGFSVYSEDMSGIRVVYKPMEHKGNDNYEREKNFILNYALNKEWYKWNHRVYMYKDDFVVKGPVMRFAYSEEKGKLCFLCDDTIMATLEPSIPFVALADGYVSVKYYDFYKDEKGNLQPDSSISLRTNGIVEMKNNTVEVVLWREVEKKFDEYVKNTYGAVPQYYKLMLTFYENDGNKGTNEKISYADSSEYHDNIIGKKADDSIVESENQRQDDREVIQEDGVFAEETNPNNEAPAEQVDHDYLWSHATNQADKAYEATCHFLDLFDTYGTRSFISESGKSAISFSEAQHSFRMDYHNISGITPDDSWEVIDGQIRAGGRNVTLYLRNSQNQEASVTGNYFADAVYFTAIVYRTTEKDYR